MAILLRMRGLQIAMLVITMAAQASGQDELTQSDSSSDLEVCRALFLRAQFEVLTEDESSQLRICITSHGSDLNNGDKFPVLPSVLPSENMRDLRPWWPEFDGVQGW